jgi:hypothetical protein
MRMLKAVPSQCGMESLRFALGRIRPLLQALVITLDGARRGKQDEHEEDVQDGDEVHRVVEIE